MMTNIETYVPSDVDPQELRSITDTIRNQNERFAGLHAIQDPELIDVATPGIVREQTDSFLELLTVAKSIPFEEMGRRAIDLQEYVHFFERQVTQAIEYSPLSEAEIRKFAKNKVHGIKHAELEVVNADILKYTGLKYDGFNDVTAVEIDPSGSWPIPVAMSKEDRMAAWNLVNEEIPALVGVGETRTVNILPTTPINAVRPVASIEPSFKKERVIDNPEAAQLVNKYLVTNVGRIITVEEVAAYLYHLDPENADEKHYRTRVTSFLGPATRGKEVQKYLSEEHGLTLQYGFCHDETYDGTRWVSSRVRKRIYRVLDDVDEASLSTTEEITSSDTKQINMWKKPGSAEETSDLSPEELEDILDEEIDGTKEQETLRDWGNVIRLNTELEATLWGNFESSVYEIIEHLDQSFLLTKDFLRKSSIIGLSDIQGLCDDNNLKQLYEAHLITEGDLKKQGMTLDQRILGAVMLIKTDSGKSVYRRVLGNKGRLQNRAKEIVQEQLMQYEEANTGSKSA